ncbi:thylakoid lumenal 15.0 kDa protein 2, chloroplastic isoform X2 [Primulina tabacum]|uniref:thylakoid lumenal 15.0 kDa protein 2, chloroplastic isoform X2 n=1 Tax=Primulina tabacum TaxID=48773 RepID=UPI003F599EDB
MASSLLQHPSSSLAFGQILLPVLAKSSAATLSCNIKQQFPKWVPRIPLKSLNFLLSGSLALSLSLTGVGFADGKVGVNRPELLPNVFTTVIDVAGFLSEGQKNRIALEIDALEKDTGYKLRVLAQNYPNTPGNILNFNVGASVDLDVPRSFWSRLAGKYGNIFYWREKGEDSSINAAVMAISTCLREPVGTNNCSEVK